MSMQTTIADLLKVKTSDLGRLQIPLQQVLDLYGVQIAIQLTPWSPSLNQKVYQLTADLLKVDLRSMQEAIDKGVSWDEYSKPRNLYGTPARSLFFTIGDVTNVHAYTCFKLVMGKPEVSDAVYHQLLTELYRSKS